MKKWSIDTEKIGVYFRLVRGGNLLFVAMLLYVMEKWVATPLLQREMFPEQMPWWVLTLLILATVCIAAGGYVINDYFDIKIDRINRPDRLIVPDIVSKNTAMRLFQCLTAVGIVMGIAVTVWARSWTLVLIFLVIPGLLWFYSASYKRQFLVGNIVVAFMAALVPLLVAFANADHLKHTYPEALGYTPIVGELYMWTGAFALFAFLTTLAREIVKDMEDEEGDREYECRTMPIKWGKTASKVVVTVLITIICGLVCYFGFAVVPFPHAWNTLSTRYIVFGVLVPCVCEVVLLWCARLPREYHNAQALMKFVMLMGALYSFVIVRML